MTDEKKVDLAPSPEVVAAPTSSGARVTIPGAAMQQLGIQVQAHVGPLPSPEVFAAYERASPGLGKIIVSMAKDEASHRRTVDTRRMDYADREQAIEAHALRRGQYCGLVVAIASFAACVTLGALGHPLAAGAVGSVHVVSLVTIFVAGRRARGNEGPRPQQLPPPEPTKKLPKKKR